MNSKTMHSLKNELMLKKQTLSQLQKQNKVADAAIDTDIKDSIDRSDAEEAWFNKERMSQHWKWELLQIDNALAKIEAGTFGICTECDEEIPLKRLRVRPDATLCLYCQETFEKESGSTRGVRPASTPIDLIH